MLPPPPLSLKIITFTFFLVRERFDCLVYISFQSFIHLSHSYFTFCVQGNLHDSRMFHVSSGFKNQDG